MKQPDPIPNDSTPIGDLVRADMAAREEVGLRTYGTKLRAGNGRDALWDAYEEALDLVYYLRQAIAERDGGDAEGDEVIEVLLDRDGAPWVQGPDGGDDWFFEGDPNASHGTREKLETVWGPLKPGRVRKSSLLT